MGLLRIATTFAAAAVAFSGYAAYRRRHGALGHHALARTPEPLQRWEGEGGAVPAVKRRDAPPEGRSDATPDAVSTTDGSTAAPDARL